MLNIIPLLVYSDFYFRFMQYLDVSLPSLSYELKQIIRKLLFLTIRVLAYVEKTEHISIRELLFLLECIICWDFRNFSTLLHYLMNSCRLQLSSSHKNREQTGSSGYSKHSSIEQSREYKFLTRFFTNAI